MGDANWNHERRRFQGGVQLDRRAEALGRRVRPKIVEPNRGSAEGERQVVGVSQMGMDATAQDIRLRANGVPLNWRGLQAPRRRGRAR